MTHRIVRFFAPHTTAALAAALLALAAGAFALSRLPAEQLPHAGPWTAVVACRWAGATAERTAELVAVPLERGFAGLDGLEATLATCHDGGECEVVVTFRRGVDPDLAIARLESRVAELRPQLPPALARQAIEIRRAAGGLAMIVAMANESLRADPAEFRAAVERLTAEMQSVAGVRRATVLGPPARSVDIAVNPAQLRAAGLTIGEILQSLQAPRETAAATTADTAAAPSYEMFGATARDVLKTYREWWIPTTLAAVRLGEIAKISWAAQPPADHVLFDGGPVEAVAVVADEIGHPGVGDAARAAVAAFAASLPPEVHCEIAYDATEAGRESARQTVIVLAASVLLVILGAFFLMPGRRAEAAVIVPVLFVVGGVSVVLWLVGGSLNWLTLLALIASAGFAAAMSCGLVDAAMRFGHDPLARGEALELAAREVGPFLWSSAAVIAAASLLPLMIGGVRAEWLMRFSLPMAIGVLLAWVAAVALAPPLFVAWDTEAPAYLPPGPSIKLVVADTLRATHHWLLSFFAKRVWLAVLLFAVVFAGALSSLIVVPDALVPPADAGCLVVHVPLPDELSGDDITAVLKRCTGVLRGNANVAHVLAAPVADLHGATSAGQGATLFVTLAPWQQRRWSNLSPAGVVAQVKEQLATFAHVESEIAAEFPGLGKEDPNRARLVLRDVMGLDPWRLRRVGEGIAQLCETDPGVRSAAPYGGQFRSQLGVKIDYQRAAELGIARHALDDAVRVALGTVELPRAAAEDERLRLRLAGTDDVAQRIAALECSSRAGSRVPLSSLVEIGDDIGLSTACRFDGLPATMVEIATSPHHSRLATLARVDAAAAQSLPPAVQLQWLGVAGEDQRLLVRAGVALAAIALVTYLVFVMALGSWSLAAAILVAVPVALLGSGAALLLVGRAADLFAWIGMIIVTGISCMVASFSMSLALARRQEEQGLAESAAAAGAAEFALTAMIAFAFAGAALPLLVTGGPAAEAFRTVGLVILGGVLSVVLLATCLLQALFVVTQGAAESLAHAKQAVVVGADQSLEVFAFLRYMFGKLGALGEWRQASDIGGVMTVTGPIAPELLRSTLTHEHVLIDFDADVAADEPRRHRTREVVARMRDFLDRLQLNNGRALVDCTPRGMGRDVQMLKDLSRLTGIRILTNTGYSGALSGKFLPPHVSLDTVDELAQRWLDEWRQGIEKTGIRPGFIKIGVNPAPLAALDDKLVRAAARTHLASGLTISSTTPNAATAAAQLAILEDEGVDPSAFIWVHANREKNLKLVLQAANAGVWVSFDELTQENLGDYARVVRLFESYKLLDRLLLSQNELGYQVGKQLGGKIRGYELFFKVFIPALFKVGIKVPQIEQLTVANPMRAFTVNIRNRPRPGQAAGDAPPEELAPAPQALATASAAPAGSAATSRTAAGIAAASAAATAPTVRPKAAT